VPHTAELQLPCPDIRITPGQDNFSGNEKKRRPATTPIFSELAFAGLYIPEENSMDLAFPAT
jgi:hypothetical protein